MLISRDPFSRTELHRVTTTSHAECAWCGQPPRRHALFQYYTEHDDATHRRKPLFDTRGFCCKSCHDAYTA